MLWVIASAVFAFYVSNFGSYDKTYGSLAAVIIFLIWLWITNVVDRDGDSIACDACDPTKQERTVGHLREPGDKRPSRRAWWDLYEKLRARVITPTYLVTFSPDRFTRNVSNGNEWIDTLFALGITLAQAKGMRPPRGLGDREEKTYRRDEFKRLRTTQPRAARRSATSSTSRPRGRGSLRQPGIRPSRAAELRQEEPAWRLPHHVVRRGARGGEGRLRSEGRAPHWDAPHRVCVMLNEAGMLTRNGARWRNGTLERVMTNPRMIGKGRRDGVEYDANIEPLMDEVDFAGVRAAFEASRQPRRAPIPKYPLRQHPHLWVWVLRGGDDGRLLKGEQRP